MEETNNVNENNQNDEQMLSETTSQMVVSENSQLKMISMGKWMKFIGIVGIIGGVLMLLGSIGIFAMLFTNSVHSSFLTSGGVFGALLYIVLGGVAIYISNLLYKAGKNFKEASELNNSDQLDEAVSDQSSYFGCVGLLTIAYLVLIVIALFFAMLS